MDCEQFPVIAPGGFPRLLGRLVRNLRTGTAMVARNAPRLQAVSKSRQPRANAITLDGTALLLTATQEARDSCS
jgi:hypothetical protein